jgi:hypothetical protein
MKRQEIETALNELNALVQNGKALEGFEKYYDENIVMQENELTPTCSKAENRRREIEFFNSVTEFRKADIKATGIGDDVSFVVWDFDYTHKDWGIRNYSQVAIQYWKDGKIIKEKFVYSN